MELCSFKFHDFDSSVGDKSVHGQVIKMSDSMYVYLGKSSEDSMENLSLAIGTPLDALPLATKVLGPIGEERSTNLARRLTKRFKVPVYVSFNLEVDDRSIVGIEKILKDELEAAGLV